jgi:hypothetical protein
LEDEELQKKREKADRYAGEPERFTIRAIKLEMREDSDTRSILYVGGKWRCDCAFFKERETCSHTMADSQFLTLKGLALLQPHDPVRVSSLQRRELIKGIDAHGEGISAVSQM